MAAKFGRRTEDTSWHTEEIALFIASVEAKTERLKSINAMYEAGKRPTQEPLSDTEAMEIARERRFEQHWKEQCA